MDTLTSQNMKKGLHRLDELLPRAATLIIGGGGAMLLAYDFPLATADIDAVPKGLSIDELKPLIESIAKEFSFPADWLNPWFSSFTHVLPADYESRLVEVFAGRNLKVSALGKEDLLLMKCFAHRQKDVAHARALVRAGAQSEVVYKRIEELARRKIPGADEAADFLDEIVDMETP